MSLAVDLSVLLLTKNEASNLRVLIPRLKPILDGSKLAYEVVVVDAGSYDGTEEFCVQNHLRFIIQAKPGFGAALDEGFRSCRGRRILTMDADLQHDPRMIPKLLKLDADIVIGSRWIGNSEVGLSVSRRILSLTLNAVFSKCLGTSIRDTSSNFRLYRRHVVENLEIEARDFDALQEILAKCLRQGYTAEETSIPFARRQIGNSNVSLPRLLLSYPQTLIRILRLRLSLLR